jgi:hypothetical protein
MSQILVNIFSSPFSLFHALFSVLLGYWVYLDATERGSNANLLWALGCTFFNPLPSGICCIEVRLGVEPNLPVSESDSSAPS